MFTSKLSADIASSHQWRKHDCNALLNKVTLCWHYLSILFIYLFVTFGGKLQANPSSAGALHLRVVCKKQQPCRLGSQEYSSKLTGCVLVLVHLWLFCIWVQWPHIQNAIFLVIWLPNSTSFTGEMEVRTLPNMMLYQPNSNIVDIANFLKIHPAMLAPPGVELSPLHDIGIKHKLSQELQILATQCSLAVNLDQLNWFISIQIYALV